MIERERTEEARAVPALSGGALAPVANAGRWVTRFCRTKPLGAIGGVITVFLLLMALLADVVAPYGPKEAANPEGTRIFDFVHLPPQAAYPMGTDHAARDVMSRIIHGARISLYVGSRTA